MGALDRVKHAFAVDPPGPAEPTPEQQGPVDRVCREVARRKMTMPGLIALELSRPLNYFAAQAMHMFSPAVWAIAQKQNHESYEHFAAFLQKRGSIDYFIARVEHFEEEFDRRDREARAKQAKTPTDAPAGLEEDHDED